MFFLSIFQKKSLFGDSLSKKFLVKIKRKYRDGKLKINISPSLTLPLTHGCNHFSNLTQILKL